MTLRPSLNEQGLWSCLLWCDRRSTWRQLSHLHDNWANFSHQPMKTKRSPEKAFFFILHDCFQGQERLQPKWLFLEQGKAVNASWFSGSLWQLPHYYYAYSLSCPEIDKKMDTTLVPVQWKWNCSQQPVSLAQKLKTSLALSASDSYIFTALRVILISLKFSVRKQISIFPKLEVAFPLVWAKCGLEQHVFSSCRCTIFDLIVTRGVDETLTRLEASACFSLSFTAEMSTKGFSHAI